MVLRSVYIRTDFGTFWLIALTSSISIGIGQMISSWVLHRNVVNFRCTYKFHSIGNQLSKHVPWIPVNSGSTVFFPSDQLKAIEVYRLKMMASHQYLCKQTEIIPKSLLFCTTQINTHIVQPAESQNILQEIYRLLEQIMAFYLQLIAVTLLGSIYMIPCMT